MTGNPLYGELLRPLVQAQTQTACRDCERPYLPGDINCTIEPEYDDEGSVVGFTVSLLCDQCLRPSVPGQRNRWLHSVK